MAWTNTEQGEFRKDFSGVEKIYHKISTAFNHLGKEHWGIYCVCGFRLGPSFRDRDVRTALQDAWKALMLEYPGLSVASDDHGKIFVVPDAQTTDQWVDRTFFVDFATNADIIITNAKPKGLPSLIYVPSSSEVVFLSQHWRTDAIGTCMLLDRLFSIMAQPHYLDLSQARPGIEQISPCLEDAAGSPENGTPELQGFARAYIDNFHQKAVNSGGLPYKGDAATLPTDPSHQDMILTREATSRLTTACKRRHISVSAAIHASLARTVFSFAPPDNQPTEYTTVMATNMRPYLPPPYNTKSHACQTYVASITPTVLRSSDFSAATAALTREYKSWHSQRFMQALREIYKYHAEKLFAPRPEGSPRPKLPSGVTLSSLGVVERYFTGDYGDGLQVDGFRFGVGMMTRQMLMYAWAFRGRLTLSVNYNEAYYDDGMAREVLTRIIAVMGEELGLELDVGAP
ncbi:MAG: hypothetical protein L6R35_001217 [Caloplaca aegaea]|nr:MAG: hypothetical protein L6R35_001217 [Caloplaca aegaea]